MKIFPKLETVTTAEQNQAKSTVQDAILKGVAFAEDKRFLAPAMDTILLFQGGLGFGLEKQNANFSILH